MTLVRVELRREYDVCKSHNVSQYVGTHTGFSGLVLRKDKRFYHGMTKEKQKELEEALGMNPGELNPRYSTGNQDPTFWDTYRWLLDDTGRTLLDLDDPRQELDYWRLRAQTKLVATLEEKESKPDAILILIEAGTEDKAKLKKTQHIKKAYIKTSDFSSAERQTLIMTYGEVKGVYMDPRSMGAEALEAKVDEIINSDAEGVLEILEHPEYKTYAKIAELFVAGVIEKRNSAYFSKDGAMLGADASDMIAFLKDKSRVQEVANLYKQLKK